MQVRVLMQLRKSVDRFNSTTYRNMYVVGERRGNIRTRTEIKMGERLEKLYTVSSGRKNNFWSIIGAYIDKLEKNGYVVKSIEIREHD